MKGRYRNVHDSSMLVEVIESGDQMVFYRFLGGKRNENMISIVSFKKNYERDDKVRIYHYLYRIKSKLDINGSFISSIICTDKYFNSNYNCNNRIVILKKIDLGDIDYY